MSGIVSLFGIPSIFGIKEKPNSFLGIVLLVGGGLIAFFAILNEATEFIQKFLPGKPEGLSRREKPYDIYGFSNPQNRRNLIANVREAWIKGVLENNLQDAVRLILHLKEAPEALSRPNLQFRFKSWPKHDISQDKSIQEIFQDSGQGLLILGAPGSGKTFTMLELVRDLLVIAESDESKPIPVVLNLSSWAQNRPPIDEWLENEIHLQYQLAKKVTRAWLENDQICLMFDGLDEVAGDHRDACVKTINLFKSEFNAPMVVCSRTEDYNLLSRRLNLSSAVEIQPLTEEQVDAYVSRPELQLQALRNTIHQNPDLRKLASAPLFLNVMTIAYMGISADELAHDKKRETDLFHLFSNYIHRMFSRRPLPDNFPFTTLQSFGWLTYLACQLVKHQQTSFFIEQLQMDWLPSQEKDRFIILLRIMYGLIYGLVFVPLSVIIFVFFGEQFGLKTGLVFGWGIWMIIGLWQKPEQFKCCRRRCVSACHKWCLE